jgi:hypothetical protein
MAVVQVNRRYAQTFQALVACFTDIRRIVSHGHLSILEGTGKLGRKKDVVALARVGLEPFANQVLVIQVLVTVSDSEGWELYLNLQYRRNPS